MFLDRTQIDARTHTQTHISGRTPVNERSARRKGPCLHNIQQAHEQKNHAFNEIRTRNPCNLAVEDVRLRLYDHRDQKLEMFNVKTATTVQLSASKEGLHSTQRDAQQSHLGLQIRYLLPSAQLVPPSLSPVV